MRLLQWLIPGHRRDVEADKVMAEYRERRAVSKKRSDDCLAKHREDMEDVRQSFDSMERTSSGITRSPGYGSGNSPG